MGTFFRKADTKEENRPIGQRRIKYVEGVPGGTWKEKDRWRRKSNNPKMGCWDTFMMALTQGNRQRGANGR
eukprot:3869676-Ditylum_brightwellii.AAC.1